MRLETKVWLRMESVGQGEVTKEVECESLAEVVRVLLQWLLKDAQLFHRIEIQIAREQHKLLAKKVGRVKESEQVLAGIFADLGILETSAGSAPETKPEGHEARLEDLLNRARNGEAQ